MFNVYNALKILAVALFIIIFALVSIKNIGISMQMGLLKNWLCKKNEHNEEHVKIGKSKRQRKSGFHAFSVVMKKQKSQGGSNNTESVEESA